MSATKVLARGFTFFIDNVIILGIDSFTPDMEVKDADSTTFENLGMDSHKRAGIGKSLKLDGKYLEANNGVQDAGQALCETTANAVGDAAECTVKYITPGGKIRSFLATVKIDNFGGGGNDEVAKWACTFKRTGGDL